LRLDVFGRGLAAVSRDDQGDDQHDDDRRGYRYADYLYGTHAARAILELLDPGAYTFGPGSTIPAVAGFGQTPSSTIGR